MSQHLLSLLIWLPILGAALVLLAGERNARWVALGVTVLTFVASLFMLPVFDSSSAAMQLVENHVWIAALKVNYHLGVDGISVALILLTTFTTVLIVIGAWGSVEERVAQYMAAMLVLEGLLVGVFCAMDALLFYVFFEGM